MVNDLKHKIFFVFLGMVFCVRAEEPAIKEVTLDVTQDIKTSDAVKDVTPKVIPDVVIEKTSDAKSDVKVDKPEEKREELLTTRSGTFYDAYLSKYFPKAMVIREKFIEGMSYDSMIVALHDCVTLLSDNPRYYIANKDEKIRFTHYWEFVLDQLALIQSFFRKAYVELQTKKILIIANKYAYIERYSTEDRKKWLKSHMGFADYALRRHPDVLYSFYALMCDYNIKLFNEGILLQDYELANKYYREIEYSVDKLTGSIFESDYQATAKVDKALLALLKKKNMEKTMDKFEETHGRD